MHVLFVDDDRVNLMLIEHACLPIASLRLSTAASGAEAHEVAQRDPPQLLVIDLHLPDTSGHALLHSLRAEAALKDVPAVLCTADEGEAVSVAALAAGFAACWTKPLDIEALRRAMAAFDPCCAG